MTTFTQLNARLKNFLRDWLLVLGLKECLVECATLCVKSEVILNKIYHNSLEIHSMISSFWIKSPSRNSNVIELNRQTNKYENVLGFYHERHKITKVHMYASFFKGEKSLTAAFSSLFLQWLAIALQSYEQGPFAKGNVDASRQQQQGTASWNSTFFGTWHGKLWC